MTIKFNLLPWREIQRKKEKQKLINWTIATLITVVIACLLTNYFTFKLIERQQNNNQKLKEDHAILDTKIQAILKIKEQKKKLINRLFLSKKLQNDRVLIVHFFDEIGKLIPEGLYLNQIRGRGTKITLQGITKSNSALSRLMQNIEANPWMRAANIIEIKKNEPLAETHRFRLNFILRPISQRI